MMRCDGPPSPGRRISTGLDGDIYDACFGSSRGMKCWLHERRVEDAVIYAGDGHEAFFGCQRCWSRTAFAAFIRLSLPQAGFMAAPITVECRRYITPSSPRRRRCCRRVAVITAMRYTAADGDIVVDGRKMQEVSPLARVATPYRCRRRRAFRYH